VRHPVSRRSFLLASAGLVAGAVAACNSNGDDGEIQVKPEDTTTLPKDLSLVVASYVHVTGLDERVAMAFIRGNGPFNPEGDVEFTIDGRPVEAAKHADGILLPYYLMRQRFDRPGVHDVKATVAGQELSAALEVVEPAKAGALLPGQPMVRVPSPTVADAKGVNPICTKKPVCPLHDVSLDAALDEKKPLAVLFSTPALCQSQLCGPVLDNLLAARAEFADKVRMLHVEIYTDLTGKTLAPAVQAYKLQAEPFLFLAGADGVVRERLDNAYDKVEVRDALRRLTSA